jgi:hypothetical protein
MDFANTRDYINRLKKILTRLIVYQENLYGVMHPR